MEKYGVEEEIPDEKKAELQKTLKCPRCNAPLKQEGILICPKCGTEPFESPKRK